MMSTPSRKPIPFDLPAIYQISVQGRIDPTMSDLLEGMTIYQTTVETYSPVTTLEGELSDQAALIGVLDALYELHLPDGPFPEHYEAVESPVENLLHPAVTSSPVAKKLTSDKDAYGKREEFPVVCTTYRLTEHFHYWTQHNKRLNMVQPDFFFEIPEEMAKEQGIANGSSIKVSSARGSILGKAMVTKRLRAWTVNGKRVGQIGFPIHWGYAGNPGHVGPLAPTRSPLRPSTPTPLTPEFKAFLVKVEKA